MRTVAHFASLARRRTPRAVFDYVEGAADLDGILSNFVTMLNSHGELQKKAGRPHWDDYLSTLPIHFSTECCMWVHGNKLYLLGPVKVDGPVNRRVAKLLSHPAAPPQYCVAKIC